MALTRALASLILVVAVQEPVAYAAPCGSALLYEKAAPTVFQNIEVSGATAARHWSAGNASQTFNSTACAVGCLNRSGAQCATSPCVAITGINWLNSANCASAGLAPTRTVVVVENPTANAGGLWAAINTDRNSGNFNYDLDAKASALCGAGCFGGTACVAGACASTASPYLGGTGTVSITSAVPSGGNLNLTITWSAPSAGAQAFNNSGSSIVTSYSIYFNRSVGGVLPANTGSKTGWARISDADGTRTTNGHSTDTAATISVPLGASAEDVTIAIGLNFDGSGDPVANPNTVESSFISSYAVTPAAPPLPAPTVLIATSTSTTTATVTWQPSAGATSYELQRGTTVSNFVTISANAISPHSDTGLTLGTTYLYRVRASDATRVSAFSNLDLATTIIFTDDPLVVGTTPVKAQHLTQLRQAVDAVRAAAGLAAGTYTDTISAGVTRIKAIHISEIRSQLDAALIALGLGAPTYTDSTLTAGVTVIKKVHVQEPRNATK
ncbi:MAG: hypothetical protein ABI779_01215 [Acidobacteriota bacterium]